MQRRRELRQFNAAFFDPSSGSSTRGQFSPRPNISPLFPRNTASVDQTNIRETPPDSAASGHSFSSMITFPSDTPRTAQLPGAGATALVEDAHWIGKDYASNVLPKDVQEAVRSCDPDQRNRQPNPFGGETSHSISLPNFRAMTSSANSSLLTNSSVSGAPLSAIDELLDLPEGKIGTDLGEEQRQGLGKSEERQSLRAEVTVATHTEPHDTETAHGSSSSQGCPRCNGSCIICRAPTELDESLRSKLFKFGHSANGQEKKATQDTLRTWLRSLVFTNFSQDSNEEGDAYLLSWESFWQLAEMNHVFTKPVVLKEVFADSGDWSPCAYADLVEFGFSGIEVDVRWYGKPQAERMGVSRLVELLRSRASVHLSTTPLNVLNLPDLAGAISPSFLQMRRFRLLDTIVTRCKMNLQEHLGKQIRFTPFDIGSCQRFNILGWPGAFSAAHVDSNGATWVRNLFGYKLWMFGPRSEMDPDDWKRFAADGDIWDPKRKCRAILLEPGNVFIMESGLVHAVYTLDGNRPCLMTGGMFLDQLDLLHSLETWYFIGKNQNATNEPIAYQLAQVLNTLEDVVERDPTRLFAGGDSLFQSREKIKKLRSLGCDCEDCDDECICAVESRRCTPLCAAHTQDSVDSLLCMLEKRVEEDEDSEQGDEQYVERVHVRI